MGSGEREAVIAGCVARLTRDSWDEAMKPLILSGQKHRGLWKTARKVFFKDVLNEGVKFVRTASTRNTLFAHLCGDDKVAVRALTDYDKSLESCKRGGQKTFAGALAEYLNIREKQINQTDAMILQPAKRFPVAWEELFPQLKKWRRTNERPFIERP